MIFDLWFDSKVNKQGFVLFTVILWLTAMTLLVVANMRWVSLYTKRYAELRRFQKNRLQFEQSALHFSQKFDGHAQASCYIKNQNSVLLKIWVRQHGCKMGESYRFGIEDVGCYPCVKFSSKLGSHHWLLSFMDERLPNQLLQFRIATPMNDGEHPCLKTKIVMIQHKFLTRRLI